MGDMNLLQKTASDLVRDLNSKEISAVELTDFYLDRIEKHNPQLNAICTVNSSARAAAEKIDQQRARGEDVGALAGLPIGVKDPG